MQRNPNIKTEKDTMKLEEVIDSVLKEIKPKIYIRYPKYWNIDLFRNSLKQVADPSLNLQWEFSQYPEFQMRADYCPEEMYKIILSYCCGFDASYKESVVHQDK